MLRQILSATLRTSSYGVLLALLAFVFDGRAARASDFTCVWQGSPSNSSWVIPSNWKTGSCNDTYPNNLQDASGNTYEVTITAGASTLTTSSVSIGSVSVPTSLTLSGGTLNLQGGGSVTTVNAVSTDSSSFLQVGSNGAGGDNLSVGTTLANGGTLSIGNDTLTANDMVSAGSVVNTGGHISISGGTGAGTPTSSLIVSGGAGTDGNSTPDGVLTGDIVLIGNSLLQFGSGAITSIGNVSILTLDGADAQVQIKGDASNNSALTSLASIGGDSILDLQNGASVSTDNALSTGSSTLYIGVATQSGANLSVGGTLTNGGTLDIGNSSQTADSTVTATGLVNNDTVAIQGSSTNPSSLQVNGAATNAATVNIQEYGNLEVNGGNAYTQTGGTTTVAGTLGGSGATVRITGGTLQGTGTVIGASTIGTGGTLVAGALGTAGTLTFSGSLHVNGTLNEIINSGTAGTGYGVISVSGALKLGAGSTLNLAQLGSYNPSENTTLTIATAGSAVSGEFGSIDNDTFNSGTESWVVVYNGNGGDNIELVAATAEALPTEVMSPLTLMQAASSDSTPLLFVSDTEAVNLDQGSTLAVSNLNNKGTTSTGKGASDTGGNTLSVSERLTNSGKLVMLAPKDSVDARTIRNSGTITENAANESISAESVSNSGALDLNGTSESVNVGGDLRNAESGTLAFNQDSAYSSVTVDGTFTNRGTTTLAGKNDTLTTMGAVRNSSIMTVGADDMVSAQGGLMNASGGTIKDNGSVTVRGNTMNNGTIIVSSSAKASWGGTFINSGTYSSDPTTSDFSNVVESSTGTMTGVTGDVFDVTGNFINNSTQTTAWNTSGVTLEFSTGTGDSHDLQLSADEVDEGAKPGGYTDNFAWGTLDIDSGNSVDILGEAGAASGLALYVGTLEGLDISGDEVTNITSDDFNIYYDPADNSGLDGETYALEDGGVLCPVGSSCALGSPPADVPEPDSLLLLASGLLGLAFARRRRMADA